MEIIYWVIAWYCTGVLSTVIGCILAGTDNFTVRDLLWALSLFGLMGPIATVLIICVYLNEVEDIDISWEVDKFLDKVLIKKRK